jgi:hypothetical protein
VNLLAFDPGGTTGVARFWLPDSALRREQKILGALEFECFEIGGTERQQGRELALLLAAYTGPIVIESFTLRKFSQDEDLLSPVRMRARIEQIVDTLEHWGPEGAGRRSMFFQEPSLAMKTVTDDRMHRWGLWVPGKEHGRDAIRHGVTFLRRAKKDRALREAAFGRVA